MTIHSSLKTKSGALSQHRNVLNRAERISKLASQEKFDGAKQSPLGIVKVRNINVVAKKAAKTKAEGDAAATPAAGAKAATPAAGAAKPAAGAKPAAAAGGAKPAAAAGGAKKK
jgi:small basic protein (TIGR04137 family)